MSPRGSDAKRIFLEAVESYEPEHWPAFLDEACGDDGALRRRVQMLLDAHGDPNRMLDGTGGVAPLVTPLPVTEGPGSMVGCYKLLEEIGEGGFGVVYRAEQTAPVRRKVALKIIKPGMDTRQVIGRFEAERQALALMDHPNIAHVLDAGSTESGRPYFAMELVKGVPITQYCDECNLSTRDRLELFVSVCHAVQHAHQKGIIHRDLKPTNVLIAIQDGRPTPKIIDFGVAKATGQRLTDWTLTTGFAQMLGTPLYMSPEQAELSALDVDTRSDIYSLGVLLYELLTSTTPFEKSRLHEAGYDEIRRVLREEEPPRPSTRLSTLGDLVTTVAEHHRTDARKLRQLVRGDLDWIVMKALEKDRTRRYATAADLAAEVQRYLNSEPIEARAPSAAYRFRKFAARNKLVIVTGGLVACTLLLGTVVSTSQAVRAYRAEGLATERLAAMDRAQRERSEKLWESYLNEARARRRTGLSGHRYKSLAALENAARMLPELELSAEKIRELRNEWIASSAVPADLRIAKQITHGVSGQFDVDPDYERYVVADHEGNLVIRRLADDREVLHLPPHGKRYWALQFSPNGRYLAARASGIASSTIACRVWDLQEQTVVLETDMADGCFALDFTPDSRLVAFGRKDAAIYLLDLEKGEELAPLAPGPAPPFRLAIDPQRRHLAVHFGGASREVHIRDLKTGELTRTLSHPGTTDGYVDWSSDGSLLAVTCGDEIYIWDVRSGRQQSVLKGHRWVGINAAFSRANDLLLSRCWDGTTRLWDPWSGTELVRSRGGLMGRHFRRDGRQAAFYGSARAGGVGGVWEVATSRTHRRLAISVPKGQERHSVTIRGEGRLLACGTDDGVRLYDLSARREIASLPIGTCYSTTFQPDDGSLITSGIAGLQRWPITVDAPAGTLHIDPPVRLATLPATWPTPAASSRDGRYVAAITGSEVVVCDLQHDEPQRSPGQLGAELVAISPNGRWLATSSWKYAWFKLWDLQTNEAVELDGPPATGAFVAFSPDGKWFVTSTANECCIWQTAEWQRVHCLPFAQGGVFGRVVFSPDGRVMAVVRSQENVQLIETATWRELATLEAFEPRNLAGLCFSADDTQLAAVTLNDVVQLWDLRRVRDELRTLSPCLDWELPRYPQAPEESPHPIPLEVDGLRAALVHMDVASWREQLAANPSDGAVCNGLAWAYAAGPSELRNVAEALPLAEKAVQAAPENAHYLNTLGVVNYRLGRFDEALKFLQKSLAAREDGNAFDCFFLAMSYHELGDITKAKEYYDKSVQWCAQQQNLPAQTVEELASFRDEAATLLGIAEKGDHADPSA